MNLWLEESEVWCVVVRGIGLSTDSVLSVGEGGHAIRCHSYARESSLVWRVSLRMVVIVPTRKRISVGVCEGQEQDIREKALVVGALVKFLYTVYAPHGGDVTKGDLVWTNANDRTVFFK